ncbi:MAG: chorismate synthase [Lachnospiraceae bacterium]
MAGSSFGNIFRITTWGESHGKAIGAVVDGCPAGIALTETDIQYYLNLRRPGTSRAATARQESDTVEILSGVFEGRTTGTPISMLIRNTDQHSGDYANIAGCYRPGHSDYTFDAKYGFRDYRGGGRSSGRETAGRVAGGAVALKMLDECGIRITAYTKSIGPVSIDDDPDGYDEAEIMRNPLFMPNKEAAARAMAYIEQMRSMQDSAGGIIECRIDGVPAGLGDPVFGKLSASLAQAISSIGAVKGFEIGEGFHAAVMRGSEDNDAFMPDGRGGITKRTNHAGGILGGISDGSPIVFRAAFKPVASISRPQDTVTRDGKAAQLTIKGRHDPVIPPRAVVVVKSMAALVIADALLLGMTSRIDRIRDFYRR